MKTYTFTIRAKLSRNLRDVSGGWHLWNLHWIFIEMLRKDGWIVDDLKIGKIYSKKTKEKR